MKASELATIIEDHIATLKKHGAEIPIQFDEEAIHDFRVTVKKLRAFVRMWRPAGALGKIKLSGRFKELYADLGIIRNLKLVESLIRRDAVENSALLPGYLQALEEVGTVSKERVTAMSFEKVVGEEAETLLKLVPPDLTNADINKFVLSYKEKLITLLTATYMTNEELHDVRKVLKDLFYNREFIQQEALLLLPGLFSDETHFKHLTHMLGDFQDLTTAKHICETTFIESNDNTIIPGLIHQWKWQCVTLKPLIVSQLHAVIFHQPVMH